MASRQRTRGAVETTRPATMLLPSFRRGHQCTGVRWIGVAPRARDALEADPQEHRQIYGPPMILPLEAQ